MEQEEPPRPSPEEEEAAARMAAMQMAAESMQKAAEDLARNSEWSAAFSDPGRTPSSNADDEPRPGPSRAKDDTVRAPNVRINSTSYTIFTIFILFLASSSYLGIMLGYYFSSFLI